MPSINANYKLNLYLSKKIFVQMIPERKVSGILRGFDQFLNLVLDEGYIIEKKKKKFIGTVLLRGNMIISIGNY
jgi:small nuclear ribonucleoprotein G